jgi:hypothetical protein
MKVEAHRMASERKAVTVFLQMMLNTKYKEQQQEYQYRIYSKPNVCPIQSLFLLKIPFLNLIDKNTAVIVVFFGLFYCSRANRRDRQMVIIILLH